MNKLKFKFFVTLFLSVCCVPCFAEDGEGTISNVVERMDCTEIQSRISELSAIENPTEESVNELTQLQNKYRSDCVKSASGRRTIGRVSVLSAAPKVSVEAKAAVAIAPSVKIADATSVLNSFVEKQKSNCQSFKSSIDSLKQNSSTASEDLEKLQKQYSEDCAKYDETVVAVEEVEVDPEKIAANIEAGLCADGSKPNRFGCCAGETFKDMGNLVFACCPDDGGDCYPPITAGTLL